MFDLVIASGNLKSELNHRLFKDGSPFRVVSEWEAMAELMVIPWEGDQQVGVPVSERMRNELRLAEDFVGPYVQLPECCTNNRRLQSVSSCWGMCLPLAVESSSYGPGEYRFTVLFDHVETGWCEQDQSTIRFLPWIERIEFRPL